MLVKIFEECTLNIDCKVIVCKFVEVGCFKCNSYGTFKENIGPYLMSFV